MATMADYNYEKEQDRTVLWTKDASAFSFSRVSRFRSWLFPAVTATVILVLIIALGTSNMKMSNRLWSMEQSVSNLTDIIQSLNASLQHAEETSRDAEQLRFAVEKNKDELISVSDALKQLSVVDSLSRSVASLKCSIDRIINNSSEEGCCPLGWNQFNMNCYFFSNESLSWNESRLWCDRHEGHLVILHDDKAWDYVTRRSVPGLFWVGLSDWRTRSWEWINQTPYRFERRRWLPGQPDGWTRHGLGPEDEDCAHLHSTGRLNDSHCSKKMRFICQRRSTRA